jgi:hypothetical protein
MAVMPYVVAPWTAARDRMAASARRSSPVALPSWSARPPRSPTSSMSRCAPAHAGRHPDARRLGPLTPTPGSTSHSRPTDPRPAAPSPPAPFATAIIGVSTRSTSCTARSHNDRIAGVDHEIVTQIFAGRTIATSPLHPPHQRSGISPATPAISLPWASTPTALPLAVQLSPCRDGRVVDSPLAARLEGPKRKIAVRRPPCCL